MHSQQSDNELINRYVKNGDTKAFETLVRRYYDIVRRRLLTYTQNDAEADDLSQAIWVKVIEYLPDYQADNKFENFINRVATNLLRDRWRRKGVRNEQSFDQLQETGGVDAHFNLKLLDNSVEHQYSAKLEVEHLTKTLIPQLPSHLRMVFLLKHEAEYWDSAEPFKWQHLAEMNNIDLATVWQHFQNARDKLVSNITHDHNTSLSDDELQIFLVWTQTQRIDKSIKFTEQYFADLLNIPVSTFKTHYRKAYKILNEKMALFSKESLT